MSEPDELISLRELASRISVNVNTVRRWRDCYGLPVYALGPRRQAVVWGEFFEWLHARQVQTKTNEAMR